MKTLETSLYLLISLVLFTFSTTYSQPFMSQNLWCVKTVDMNNIQTVGDEGYFASSSDAGKDWSYVQTGANNMLCCVLPIDELTTVACGSGGIQFKSIDGGQSWASTQTPTTNDLMDCALIQNYTIVCVGMMGTIIRSTDAGDTWVSVDCPTMADLLAVKFIDDNMGFAVGTNGTILSTFDGGNTWSQGSLLAKMQKKYKANSPKTGTNTNYALRSITFFGPNGIIVGDNMTIFNSFDMGNTWTLTDSTCGPNLNKIRSIDPNNAIAVGDNTCIIRTEDGGQTWAPVQFPTQYSDANLRCLAITPNGAGGFYCIAVGDNNTKVYSNNSGLLWDYIYETGFIEHNKTNLTAKKEITAKNFPNPFNPTTVISYSVPFDANVSVKIYDILGRNVATLFDGFEKAGTYSKQFNASNLASGVYFYRITAASGASKFEKVMKMLLNK